MRSPAPFSYTTLAKHCGRSPNISVSEPALLPEPSHERASSAGSQGKGNSNPDAFRQEESWGARLFC